MGILDKLFGSRDPLKNEINKNIDEEKEKEEIESKISNNYDKDSDNWPPFNVLYGKDKWPYEIEPEKSEVLTGRELYTIDKSGSKWMGKGIRDKIEGRRYNKKAPTVIGYTKDNVKGVQDVYIDHESLFKHLALFGSTGQGKSTLMRNVMLQWINSGAGICYIDPKGEDSYELLQQIPPHRIDDLIWVEPASAKREKQIGFNVFDTATDPGDPRYENEVSSVASDFVNILEKTSEGSFGPQVMNITETLVTQLVKSDDPFNPIDMVKIATDEEEQQAFANHYGDELDQIFLKRIAEQDDKAFDAILRRIRSWVDTATRQIMAQEESKISITEAVLDGKLLIVDTSKIEDTGNTKEIVTRMILSRVWSAIKTRDEENEELDPYFLCIDEFDKLVTSDFELVNNIISMGRSKRLSVFVANQQPSQLPKNVKQSIQQVQSLLSFNPGTNPGDQQAVAQALGDVDSWRLNELEEYELVGRPHMNGSQQGAMLVKTFGEYPPLRDEEAVEEIINNSLDKYGTKPDVDTDPDKYGAQRFINNKSEGYEINKSNDTITEEQMLECIYSASLRNNNKEIDDKDDWVTLSQVKEEVNKYAEGVSEAHDSKLSNILEKFTSRELEKTVSGSSAYFRLGNEGLKKAFEPDTGAAASGGKSPHRILLREGHEAFTKLGYSVTLPNQDRSGSLPDGLAKPPIDPMKESDKFDDAADKEKELIEKYPRLAQLFGDQEIALEAESTTITRPAQTIKNLIKAIRNDRHCVFIVKDGSEKRDEFEYWARIGERILKNPPFVRSMDENGNRKFYTTNSKIELSNKGTVLVPKDIGQVYWEEYGKGDSDPGSSENASIRLSATDQEEPLATFDHPGELWSKPSPTTFPYNYIRDNRSKETLVKDSDNNVVETYDNLTDLQSDGKYRPVHLPIIPEQEFPNGEYPSEDSWTFIIIPESNSEGPVIYDEGEIEPLLPEDGAKIDPNDFNDFKIDVDVRSIIPENQLKDEFDDIVDSESKYNNIKDNEKNDLKYENIEDRQSSAIETMEEDEHKEDEHKEDEHKEDEHKEDEDSTDLTSIPDDHKFPEKPSKDDD